MEVTESSYCYVRLIFTVFDALFYVYCIRMKSDTFFTLTNYLFILLVPLCTKKIIRILSDEPSNQKQVNLSKKWCLLCVRDWAPWWNIGLANDQKECFFFQWQMRPMRKYPSKNIDKFDFCFKMFLSASYSENVFYICFFSMICLLKTWVNIYIYRCLDTHLIIQVRKYKKVEPVYLEIVFSVGETNWRSHLDESRNEYSYF